MAMLLLALLLVQQALSSRVHDKAIEGPQPKLKERELIVTTWSILSFDDFRNPFEFGSQAIKSVLLMHKRSKKLMVSTKTVIHHISLPRLIRVNTTLQSCAFPVRGLKEKCQSHPMSALWLYRRTQLTLQDFLHQLTSDGHKARLIDAKWQIRIGFNDELNCNPKSNNNGTLNPSDFEMTDVADLLLLDMIRDVAYYEHFSSMLQKWGRKFCEHMYAAPSKHVASVVKVLSGFQTDVAFLTKVPKWWLSRTAFGQVGLLEAQARMFGLRILAAVPPADENTVIVVRNLSFGTLPRAATHDTIKGLSAKLVPAGLEKPVTFVGMHLRSASQRKVGLKFVAETFPGPIVVAGDTGGDPRSRSYAPSHEDEGLFFKEEGGLVRATEAPWDNTKPNQQLGPEELSQLPAFGTVNRERTGLSVDLRDAGKTHRLMADNIFYKSGGDIEVEQLDLCLANACSLYTHAGRMRCFSVNSTPDEEGTSFARPMTCGYVGEDALLPGVLEDWSISDHAPITAKLKIVESSAMGRCFFSLALWLVMGAFVV